MLGQATRHASVRIRWLAGAKVISDDITCAHLLEDRDGIVLVQSFAVATREPGILGRDIGSEPVLVDRAPRIVSKLVTGSPCTQQP
jgi:hypothetical protein